MKRTNNCGMMGSNIFLKVVEEKDLGKIFEWKNNYELSRLIKTHAWPVATYEMEEWFKKNQSDKKQVLFGVYDLKSEEIIGVVRLMYIDWISSVAEFGVFIGEEMSRGKGLGKEVVKLALDFAFRDINLHKVYLKVLESNTKAICLYETCGFAKEGLLRDHFWINGGYENVIIMGILRGNDGKI